MDAALGAAGQVPDDKGINVAEEHFALLSLLAYAFDILEDPFDLGAGEIGRQGQADFLAEAVLAAVLGQFIADLVGAGILPDDGIVDGLSGGLLPDDRGLALVGDTDRCDIRRGNVALLSAPAITSWVRSQISTGLCSTQPGFG